MLQLFFFGLLLGQPLHVVSFNVESGQANIDTLTEFVADEQGCDVWGFAEVLDAHWAERLEEAAEVGESANFEEVLGTTGREDLLLIVYNTQRLELLKSFELDHINVRGRVRAPLVALFKDLQSGQKFYFMVNHLYRGNAEGRHLQATLLNTWGKSAKLPVIAVGDYNFDWEVQNGDQVHDLGYDNMIKDHVFTWVRPPKLVKTHSHPDYDTVLDFVFLSEQAQSWPARAEIVEGVNGPLDDLFRSDHLPIRAVIEIPALKGYTNKPSSK
ncbi:MAG: endonuclease/exonuclease/phosphatase [Acidobacteria bacterium]|nr:endonuclease/exonuclease/phosphatase [Acidobacteriota bacterium]MCB9398660.1 endonuclease/exonuclease/phosphatase [Acidobacteriota bacterium]